MRTHGGVSTPDAWDSVVQWHGRFYDRLVRRIWLVLGEEAEAEDCVQDAFRIAHARLCAGADIREPEAWLRRVSVNAALRVKRRRTREQRALTRIGSPDPMSSDAADGWATRVAVEGLIDSLPPSQRALLVLHYWDGLPIEEVASTLGLKVGTVKSRMARVRTNLARAMEGEMR